ncbi:membrane protein [Thalassobaculum fulvum]|uniref:Membrane protein n=1 Tax=Thalassobaculum fulvum TaxID=1633335 RepID=A0A919CQX4_9PROT|nr:BrnT family toxin [Thalassobaculum fulvum]GHD56192.1 membrane protein [Thalassobaculum fulvum]
MQWTWDDTKDRRNRAKHGLPLSMGEVGLNDPLAISVPDPHPDGDRWISICAVGGRTVVVVHTWPDDGDREEAVGRIISVRPATSHERKRYEDGG